MVITDPVIDNLVSYNERDDEPRLATSRLGPADKVPFLQWVLFTPEYYQDWFVHSAIGQGLSDEASNSANRHYASPPLDASPIQCPRS